MTLLIKVSIAKLTPQMTNFQCQLYPLGATKTLPSPLAKRTREGNCIGGKGQTEKRRQDIGSFLTCDAGEERVRRHLVVPGHLQGSLWQERPGWLTVSPRHECCPGQLGRSALGLKEVYEIKIFLYMMITVINKAEARDVRQNVGWPVEDSRVGYVHK